MEVEEGVGKRVVHKGNTRAAWSVAIFGEDLLLGKQRAFRLSLRGCLTFAMPTWKARSAFVVSPVGVGAHVQG